MKTYKIVVTFHEWDDEEMVEMGRTVYIEADDSKSAEAKAAAFGRAQYEEDFVGVASVVEFKS